MFKLINQTNLNLVVTGDNFSSHLITPGGYIIVKIIDKSNEELIRRKLIRVEEIAETGTNAKEKGPQETIKEQSVSEIAEPEKKEQSLIFRKKKKIKK